MVQDSTDELRDDEMAELEDDTGKVITMLGKEYYFCMIPSGTDQINIKNTVYDQCFWMTFHEAYFIAEKIYQKGKKRVTIKILNTLNNLGLIE